MVKLSESERHVRLLAALDHTSVDPTRWRAVCDEIAGLLGATGTLLIPYDASERGLSQPHSASLDELLETFISTGWHKRDFRSTGFPKAISTGFVTDQDLIAPEKMDRHPYYAGLLRPAGLKWFVGTAVNVNDKIWGVAVHGTPRRGPFLSADVDRLLRIRGDLAIAARRVAALGVQKVEALEQAFSDARRGVVALDWSGKIGRMNERAEAYLREADLVAGNRLRSRNPLIDAKLSELIAGAIEYRWPASFTLPGAVLVPLPQRRLVSVDAVPMPRDFGAVLSGTSAMVTLHEVSRGTAGSDDLRTHFRLTGRESELALHLAAGLTPTAAAEIMGLSVATARQHLKSVLAKTGTHRQAELVALLSRHLG